MMAFYGMSLKDIMEISQKDYMVLNKSMLKLKAFERLEEIRISGFSNLTKDSKDKLIEHYTKMAGFEPKTIQVKSFADLGAYL